MSIDLRELCLGIEDVKNEGRKKIEVYGQVETLRRRVERMLNRTWTLCG